MDGWMDVSRGVMIHLFMPKIFGTGLFLLRCTCVLHKYSVVLTTAQVELLWKLPVLYIVTFDKKQSLIFQIV